MSNPNSSTSSTTPTKSTHNKFSTARQAFTLYSTWWNYTKTETTRHTQVSQTATYFPTYKQSSLESTSKALTASNPLHSFSTPINHRSSTTSAKWTHNSVAPHGWAPISRSSSSKTSPSATTTSTAESTTHKSSVHYQWSKTIYTPAPSTKSTKVTGRTFRLLSQTPTRSREQTYSDSRQKSSNTTR